MVIPTPTPKTSLCPKPNPICKCVGRLAKIRHRVQELRRSRAFPHGVGREYKKDKKKSLPKKTNRKNNTTWKAKKGPRYAVKLSQATYDKMKQAHSMIADQPGKRREIKVVYRKAMDLQNEIDKIKHSGNGEEGIHCFAPYHGRTPFVV